ncbi:glycine--tRNA ligase subunit beta [Stagnimonas aquatica]|uniref:Glycine--tRNA ligase beta subunit n=1 Tax=Stagnimonas aquatica TaxID=2689987 RepID=A0A3N0VK74_9GAMM|nr:glycine--tRNA ligase subunit beta [Stagnimonas aquatica]ROH93166.1 glycine--tRNA ligase subunit beta [Stagnimonas aquatica]
MKHALLIEIGCEDLPARYVLPLAEALRSGTVSGLDRRGVAHGEAKLYATPRRIAVQIAEVAATQPEQSIERSGPALAAAYKDGQPTPAALGFARSCGVDFAALGQKDGKLHFARAEPGKPTVELMPAIFEETLKGMDELVPKRMRWGDGEETFVRPVQWLLALLGETVVPLHRFGLDSGRLSYGHRFHAPAAIELKQPADYESVLKAAKVWAEVSSRKAEIRRQIEATAAELGGHARITEDLLDEVTALVEWPVVIAGGMESRFTDELPPEVIVATVETNQRYFTVFEDAALTKLKPVFITIANIVSKDASQIVSGNERVVRPRLTDALFFWEQDKKQPLSAYGAKLESATYQKELGSVAARVGRIKALARAIVETRAVIAEPYDFGAGTTVTGDVQRFTQEVVRAAELCKNDLVTKMVFEFPELQGLMGGYYARASGESAAVANAIREHYLPVQQGTPIPSTREGQVLSLADKLDALAGIFAIGQKPTASKDPFALRRAANGVLRICIEGGLRLDLSALLRQALDLQPAGKKDSALHGELLEFVLERLRALLVTGGVSTEIFEAVKATGVSQPLDFAERLRALQGFAALPASANLAAAHKRVRNLLKQAGTVSEQIDPALFEQPAEHALFTAINGLQLGGSYASQLDALAGLRDPVDDFFAAVMVNADNPAVRANRLALLARLDKLCRSVADISLLPG